MPGNSLGHVDDKRTFMDMANAFLLPVLLAFRPVEPALSRVHENKLTVSRDVGVIGSDDCLVLCERTEHGGKWRYWVNPKQDYHIVRYTFCTEKGKVADQCDITYEQDSKSSEWYPSSWKSSAFFSGVTLRESVTARVTSIAINTAIQEAMFHFSFPPGTRVYSSVDGKLTIYLVEPNGTRHIPSR